MKLIDGFSMTPFTRTAWVSTEAKSKWEQAVQDCSALAYDLEIESVAAGQRPCAWQTMKRESLPDFSRRCAERGLSVLPVRWVGSFSGFVHYTPPGDDAVYCIVAGKIEDALRFRDAFDFADHETQGEMLGFPKCCREAFAANWKLGFFDPIWQSAGECSNPEAHPYSIPLLRYIGLRVGFHIPCSFNCQETISAGADRLSLAKDKDVVTLLEALLSMPMEAELLHGILVVRTPLFYLIQYTIPTEGKYTIKVKGNFIPKEGEWRERAKV